MFRLFKQVLPNIKSIVTSRNVSAQTGRPFEYFCRDEYSVKYFQKSQQAFAKALKYFEANNLSEAKKAIDRAIENGNKVESVTPNSFMLNLFNLEEKIVNKMVGDSNGTKPQLKR